MIIIIKITSYTDKRVSGNFYNFYYNENKNKSNRNNFFQINIISKGGGEGDKYYENL
jgi:hypothetical protein